MSKKTVNYERGTVTRKSELEITGLYSFDAFVHMVTTFAEREGMVASDVNLMILSHYEDVDMVMSITRPETDAEMAARIANEEAKIERDRVNAERSQAKQKDRDAEKLNALIQRYGKNALKKMIDT